MCFVLAEEVPSFGSCVRAKLLQLFPTLCAPMAEAHQAPLSMYGDSTKRFGPWIGTDLSTSQHLHETRLRREVPPPQMTHVYVGRHPALLFSGHFYKPPCIQPHHPSS